MTDLDSIPQEIVNAMGSAEDAYVSLGHGDSEERLRTMLAAVWAQVLEYGPLERCGYTFAHTRNWCGNPSCRAS